MNVFHRPTHFPNQEKPQVKAHEHPPQYRAATARVSHVQLKLSCHFSFLFRPNLIDNFANIQPPAANFDIAVSSRTHTGPKHTHTPVHWK